MNLSEYDKGRILCFLKDQITILVDKGDDESLSKLINFCVKEFNFPCPDCGRPEECCICEGDCCPRCGKQGCNEDCCDRCGSPSGTCQCYEGSPLSSEDSEHRTGNWDDLI